MQFKDLSKEIQFKITLGHLLIAWDVISNQFSDLQAYETLSDEEKRAIWGLEDLLENTLAENGFSNISQADWLAIINKSKEYIKTVPVDFLE